MINALHLIWILPATFMFGYIMCGLMSANKGK